ncbi:allene oxide synthase [Selaginella moellendorffii]|nr:allene oxide synthase [Selaginella moellendorffii]|eukprot:XP_002964012.2 allene oxide synthase [Selaginella moellendorffii]
MSMSKPAAAAPSDPSKPSKPLKEVPGSYGLPVLGAVKDRLDFYWFQGDTEFFRIRMEQHKSTVFRVNYSPGPPGYPDSRGIILLDQKSFSVLLDNSKVDKSDTLLGPYIPNLAFTGGYRVLPYLDTSEAKHTAYKDLIFELLHVNSSRIIPEYNKVFAETAGSWEERIAKSGKAEVFASSDSMITKFLLRTIVHKDPAEPGPASLGPKFRDTYQLWTGVNFAGIAHTPLPHFLEELLFHTFRLPPFLVKKQYKALANFYRTHATEVLDLAEKKYGLDREETVHQLILILGINARLGLHKMIPALIYYLGLLGEDFQAKIAAEVRSAVHKNRAQGEEGVNITTQALLEMPLLRSTVLETLRLTPSIFYIYGRAREDMVIESHDAAFQIKKGELLGGHQYFVMRDPEVFEEPHKFVADRFLGERGKAVLPYLVWSNGRETESPSSSNKQCPAKDVAELITMQFVAEMFLRYDSFEITKDSFINTTELNVHLKSLKKRSV